VERFEPKFGVLFFVASGLFEDRRDLLIPFFTRFVGVIGVLVAGLRLASESGSAGFFQSDFLLVPYYSI
jgi:hypothetical protein